ncbi:MAG: aminotransferase class III-fold pyridoxal phosphate-dependent enzyme [Alphaproteobacteria bacterium]|nr:aminotransferase class III-fold pyridoxal phosphate-dependent enzyme [Alphaproteobacteria bacterium]
MVVLAKGLGSGYAPLGAVLMPESMVNELAELSGFNYSHTYNANPITCAVGVAVLKEYQDRDLMGNARIRGAQIRAGLEKLASRHRVIGDVRGRGLLLGVELVTNQKSKGKFPPNFPPTEHIRCCGLKHGLIIYSRRTANGKNGDWFIVAPPLTITADEADELLERLSSTLQEFETIASPYLEQ